MLDELAAAACLSGHHAEAVELCDRLLFEGKLPKAEVKRVKSNRESAVAMERLAKDRAQSINWAESYNISGVCVRNE